MAISASVGVPTRSTDGPANGNPVANLSPHPGTLEIWEQVNGSQVVGLDPSTCYQSACEELLANVYETLIAYNGSEDGPVPADFQPELATCVPGSAECRTQFGGSDLVYDNATTGLPQFYSFELDAGARFFDPATNASWAVFPSDVLYSMARTLGFADLPYVGATPGWILAQALLPNGPFSWDGGTHSPYNNTPGHVLTSVLVNDSAYCPSSTVVVTDGCVTFDVQGSATTWPEFLEFVANPLGASVESCGFDTYAGARVPGFWGTNDSYGDEPCLLPGNATSTTSPAFQAYLQNTPPTGWDSFEEEALNATPPQPSIQWLAVGSGPYDLSTPVQPSAGYQLDASPVYRAPIGCVGQPACLPSPKSYLPRVDVSWEGTNDTLGLAAARNGLADSVSIVPASFGSILQNPGYEVGPSVPTLSFQFTALSLTFSPSLVSDWDSCTSSCLNVNGSFFDSLALREFLVRAYPYTSIEQSLYTVDGVPFAQSYGGGIPPGMGYDYPSNVPWPSGDPVPNATETGNVAWWWLQATTPSSSWYDPALSNCTTATPCTWPELSLYGDGLNPSGPAFQPWNDAISNLSGGVLAPYVVSVNYSNYSSVLFPPYCYTSLPTGNVPCVPVSSYNWVTSYPDPTTTLPALYNSTDAFADPELGIILENTTNDAPTCPTASSNWSALQYWADVGEVPQDCQGAAYRTLDLWSGIAATDSNQSRRALEYDLIEQIANELALYVYDPESLDVYDHADWIQGSSINTNPMLGGQGVQLWYQWRYVPATFSAIFDEVGLSGAVPWSVDVNGTSVEGSTSSLVASGLTNGTYSYVVAAPSGYQAEPSGGSLSIEGANSSTDISFRLNSTSEVVTFEESGLPSSLGWEVELNGTFLGAAPGTPSIVAQLSAGAYPWHVVGPPAGYLADPSGGVVLVEGQPVTIAISFSLQSGPTASHPGEIAAWSPGYGWVLGIILAGSAIVAFVLLRRVRRKPPPRALEPSTPPTNPPPDPLQW